MPDETRSTLRRVILPGALLALLVAGASLIALAVVVNLGGDQRLPLRFGSGEATVTLRQGSAGARDPGRGGHQRSASRGGRRDPGPSLIAEPAGAATLVPGDADARAARARRQAQLRRTAPRRVARPRPRRRAAPRPIAAPPAAAPPAAAAPAPGLASVPAAAASPAPAPATSPAPAPGSTPAKHPSHDDDDGDDDHGHDDDDHGDDDDGHGDHGDDDHGHGDD